MSHHSLELTPSDLLFFKDGRPMEGSSSGCGAAWPLPNVLSSVLHHALRRASHQDVHSHTPKRSGKELIANRERQFGSLQSAGPFPIDAQGRWLFPRPADAQKAASSTITHQPMQKLIPGAASSLHDKLRPVISTMPPTKEEPEPWITAEAFQAYLERRSIENAGHFLKDAALFGAEHQIGIGISPETGTQDGERFYSASYLRLRENVRLGVIASCMDKGTSGQTPDLDLVAATFPNSGRETRILAGGQQRICTVTRTTPQTLPLPLGPAIEGTRVKWTLLSPAVFPDIPADTEKNIPHHPGGWLPTWIDANLDVQLKDPEASRRQSREGRSTWRKRVASLPPIKARLVAALVSKPLPVTGWALQDVDNTTGELTTSGGARATHLAVPAGSVYYFQCEDHEAAKQLAAALNWHGVAASVPLAEPVAATVPVAGHVSLSVPHEDTCHAGRRAHNPHAGGSGHIIANRRSTLLGEKGFGIGVCSPWT